MSPCASSLSPPLYLSFSLSSRKPLVLPLCATFFYFDLFLLLGYPPRLFFFFFFILLCPSFSTLPASSSSLSFYPYFLPNAITRCCYRAEHNYRSALYPRDVERGELTIRQFKSTILILTVTPIIIFHITLGRRDKKGLQCLSSPLSLSLSLTLFRHT